MAWWELRIEPVYRAVAEPLGQRLLGLGASGLQEHTRDGAVRQPWDDGPEPPPPRKITLIAWFDEPFDRSRVEETVREVQGIRRHTLAWSVVPEVDWEAEARDRFRAVRISDRLTVAPPWDAPPGALIVEPGLGFGTGDHPTTRQALRALDDLLEPGKPTMTVIDVGCGSGILLLGAAKLGARGLGVDIEVEAIAEAKRHAERNGLSRSAEFSTIPVAAVESTADIVVANLHAELIVELAPHLTRLSRRWLILAGILADREHLVERALAPLRPTFRVQEGEWVSWRIRL